MVTDKAPGPAASHGLAKLMAALRAKDILCEKADSLDDARGKFILAAGLATGDGPGVATAQGGKPPRCRKGRRRWSSGGSEWQGKPVWVIARLR